MTDWKMFDGQPFSLDIFFNNQDRQLKQHLRAAGVRDKSQHDMTYVANEYHTFSIIENGQQGNNII